MYLSRTQGGSYPGVTVAALAGAALYGCLEGEEAKARLHRSGDQFPGNARGPPRGFLGAKILPVSPTPRLRLVFALVIAFLGVQMVAQGAGG